MTEPTTEPPGIEQRKWLTEHPERADEDDVRRLLADVERLTQERDGALRGHKTDHEAYATLKAKLEQARGLVVQGKNEIDTAIAALETDSCWCSSKHRCYRCRALDTLRPTLARMSTFLKEKP